MIYRLNRCDDPSGRWYIDVCPDCLAKTLESYALSEMPLRILRGTPDPSDYCESHGHPKFPPEEE